jgi:hypothetical protein
VRSGGWVRASCLCGSINPSDRNRDRGRLTIGFIDHKQTTGVQGLGPLARAAGLGGLSHLWESDPDEAGRGRLDVGGKSECVCVYLQGSHAWHRAVGRSVNSEPTNPPHLTHQQERQAHLSTSTYPSVLSNIAGCFLMGAMYELRVRVFFGAAELCACMHLVAW